MSERTPRFLWMEVSKDGYELPLAVADSALELAERNAAATGANTNVFLI